MKTNLTVKSKFRKSNFLDSIEIKFELLDDSVRYCSLTYKHDEAKRLLNLVFFVDDISLF